MAGTCSTATNRYVALQQSHFGYRFEGDIAMENARSSRQSRNPGERVPTVIETILQVIAEAIESASAARCRYPLAD
jgi:hypothetical protein